MKEPSCSLVLKGWFIAVHVVLNRLWINATKGNYSYVLTSLSGNTLNFAFALNTTGSNTMAKFIYLTNEVCHYTTDCIWGIMHVDSCRLAIACFLAQVQDRVVFNCVPCTTNLTLSLTYRIKPTIESKACSRR